MNTRFRFLGLILMGGIISASLTATATTHDKPNIIVIMADDIGAEGLACYNSAIYTTPNLDKLAETGARFENAYATPLCTPTRVMIMSGQYPNRTGYKALMSKEREARIPIELKTFGGYFKDNGYRTAIAGKWQLGQFDAYPNQPVEHGFERYCMWKWRFNGKKTDRYYGPGIWRDGISADGDETTFGPDAYTDFVLDFIAAEDDRPYFVYFPMALVHSPFIVPPFLKELAYAKYHGEMDDQTRNFGHMITYMDMLIGKIVEKVRETGQEDNTLIIFTADNGCHPQITSRLGGMDLKGGKGDMTEAGTRVPLICYWPGKIPQGKRDQLFSLADILPTIASLAGVEIGEVDGMDLSHNLLGTAGKDRDHVFVYYKEEAFVRDARFRLNEKGELFDIPVTSDESRYSEKVTTSPEHASHRRRLQAIMDKFMAIEPMYEGVQIR